MCVTKAENRPKLYCLEIGVNAATFRGHLRKVVSRRVDRVTPSTGTAVTR